MTNRVVKVTLRGEIGDLTAKMSAAGKSVAATTDKLTATDKQAIKTRQSLTTLGATARNVGLVAAGGLAVATKAAMDWESAWTGVTKTVNGTDAELAKVETGLRDLATTLPATHAEIAGVAEAAGQLGVATEDVVAFTRTMVDLSETTNLTADEAATSIAQMANVMGTSGDDIDNLGSALVALGNDGASTEKQIIQMAQGISGAAAIVGASEADVLAIANAVASMGIEVEAGGTAVSRVLTDMAKATAQGGEDLDLFAQTAGMSADQFVTSFKDRPAAALAAFTTGLDQIRASGGDVFTTLDDLGLSEVRVSRALLGMAASGDLLTDSLHLGSEAWSENTALAEEAEKRYGTAASRVQVSINEIKDSAIEFGDTVLPVFADAAEGAGDFASAIGDLPGPVKSATTGLLGITAVTSGGLWFGAKTIRAVADTRAALDDLGTSGVRAGRMLRTGLALGAVVGGLSAVDSALDELFDRDLDESKLGRSLDALAQGQISGELEKTFGEGLKYLGLQADLATNKLATFHRFEAGLPGVGKAVGAISSLFNLDPNDAIDNFEKIDASLTSLVESGNTEAAALQFGIMAKVVAGSGVELDRFKSLFPEYQLALGNATTVSLSLTDALGGVTTMMTGGLSAIDSTTGKLQTFAGVQALNAAQLEESRKAAEEAAMEFFGLGDSLEDAEVSLGGWLTELENQAKALRDFTSNLQTAADKGLRKGLIAELEAAGPAGAMRLAQLADASESEIKRANKAWARQQEAIRNYVDAVGGVPPAVTTKVNAETDAAKSELNVFSQFLTEVTRPRTVKVKVALSNPGAAGGIDNLLGQTNGADGMTVPGQRYPYGDRTLILAAPGEELITNRHGEADQFRADRAAGRIPAYADGGTVGGLSTYSRSPGSVNGETARDKLKRFEKALERSEKAIDAETSARDDLVSAQEQLISTVKGAFTSDIFGDPGDQTWLTGAQRAASLTGDPIAQLRKDIADAEAFQAALQTVTSKGVTGGAFQALAETGDVARAQAFAGLSANELATYQSLFSQREHAATAVGTFAGNTVYSPQIAESNQHLAAMNQKQDRLEKKVEELTKRLEGAAKNHASEVTSKGKASKRAGAVSVRVRSGKALRW